MGCSVTGASKCSNQDNGKTRIPQFKCTCNPGYGGELCDVNCNSKGLKKSKDDPGLPLTVGLSRNNFKASGSIHANSGPPMVSYSTMAKPFIFNVNHGGFENVWISQQNGQKWIEIDLGEFEPVITWELFALRQTY